MVFHATSLALKDFRCLVLATLWVSSPVRGSAQSTPSSTPVKQEISAILAQVKRIDAANESPDQSGHHSLNYSHWQFTGLFDHARPRLLNATFSEGSVVRQETYYLVDDKPVLVKVLRWWDVEDEKKAPEPPVRQEFYIDNGQTIRHTIRVGSARKPQVSDIPQPAGDFKERADLISKILLTNSRDPQLAEPLESFSAAELPEK
jgi:hypothetical protein